VTPGEQASVDPAVLSAAQRYAQCALRVQYGIICGAPAGLLNQPALFEQAVFKATTRLRELMGATDAYKFVAAARAEAVRVGAALDETGVAFRRAPTLDELEAIAGPHSPFPGGLGLLLDGPIAPPPPPLDMTLARKVGRVKTCVIKLLKAEACVPEGEPGASPLRVEFEKQLWRMTAALLDLVPADSAFAFVSGRRILHKRQGWYTVPTRLESRGGVEPATVAWYHQTVARARADGLRF
jgi:hypothetical protein